VIPELHGLALRPALLAAGVTDDELRRLRRQQRLAVLRPGAYVAANDVRLADEVARHTLAVRAALTKVAPGAVVSHVSAAAVHGLTLWDVPLDRVHVTVGRGSGGRRTGLLHVHAATLHPDDVVCVGKVVVTSVARTIVDLARTLPFEQALVVADAARHRHQVTAGELAAAAARAARRRGAPDARRVVAAADPRSESPGETRSRVAIARAGLPAPTLQHLVPEIGARTDFYCKEFGTVGEFDGALKYGRGMRPGQNPSDVVVAEKRREEALQDLGLKVVRWYWDELSAFDAVAARLRRTFDRPRP
jgi:hypothetical protein